MSNLPRLVTPLMTLLLLQVLASASSFTVNINKKSVYTKPKFNLEAYDSVFKNIEGNMTTCKG